MESSTSWEDLYREKETPWDKGEAAPPLVQWLGDHSMTGEVFVPGCGLGHDCRAIAGADEKARVTGFDISATAVKMASEMPVVNDEVYRQGDLFDLPEDFCGRFDWAWEHTCFCAIDPEMRDAYVHSIANALKPDGQLLGVFYLDPYDEEHRPGEGPPHGTSLAELEERFVKSGVFTMLDHWVPTVSYAGREGLEMMIQFAVNS